MTTAWYIEQSRKLDAVTRELRIGNPLKHQERLRKIDKASVIMETVFAVSNAFGRTKQTEEAQVAAKAIIELGRQSIIKQFNKVYES